MFLGERFNVELMQTPLGYKSIRVQTERKGTAIFAKMAETPVLVFPSVSAAVEAGFARNESQVNRFLKKEWN